MLNEELGELCKSSYNGAGICTQSEPAEQQIHALLDENMLVVGVLFGFVELAGELQLFQNVTVLLVQKSSV